MAGCIADTPLRTMSMKKFPRRRDVDILVASDAFRRHDRNTGPQESSISSPIPRGNINCQIRMQIVKSKKRSSETARVQENFDIWQIAMRRCRHFSGACNVVDRSWLCASPAYVPYSIKPLVLPRSAEYPGPGKWVSRFLLKIGRR